MAVSYWGEKMPLMVTMTLVYLMLVLFAVWAIIQAVVALRSMAASLREIADKLVRL